MKKNIWSFVIISAFIFIPSLVFADLSADISAQTGAFAGKSGANLGTPKDPRDIVASIIKTALTVMGTLILVYMLYGGSQILFSNGEEAKVTKGKKTIMNATIGLLLILSAYGITILATRLARPPKIDGNYCEIKLPQKDVDPMGGNTVPFIPKDGPYKDCVVVPY